GGGRIEADTVVSRESFDVAVRAAGTVCAAVDLVLQADVPSESRPRQALCLVRPPGHHARPAAAMGFCLFNNVAVAAAHALEHHGLNRVLIVDWDVHHGNGTQEIFYATDRVHFLSVHRHPFYPGTGSADERGTGPGLGATWNLPLRFGTPRREYIRRFTDIVEQAAEVCRPELVLISAGFDAHHADPIGSLGLETGDFATLTRIVQRIADRHAGGRIVSTLEGGYNLQALAESVAAHLTTLLEG
ncbi:MAG: histone deacetylase, partial [Planctomycetota bacterium]